MGRAGGHATLQIEVSAEAQAGARSGGLIDKLTSGIRQIVTPQRLYK
jgi:hypothetical protein